MPVDVFLDGFPPPMRAIAEELREVVRAATPEAIERVRLGWRLLAYDLPVKRRGVFFAWVGPEAKHVHLGFPWGVRMTDADRRLRGAGITKRARWLTFVPGDPIDRPLLEALVLEAAALAGLPRTA
jgi:uncharacterized protein YdhG (YjbR/CyaY superfamily)